MLLSAGSFGLIGVASAEGAYLAAGLFGLGIGGIMTLLPVAWADYFGRESYGAIRGVVLSLQVLAQAVGSVAVRRAARLERQLHRFAALLAFWRPGGGCAWPCSGRASRRSGLHHGSVP